MSDTPDSPDPNTPRKAIPGYEDFYSVTEDGRVFSEKREVVNSLGITYRVKARWLTQFDLGDGYLRVNLRKPGHIKMFCTHWLVARTYLPAPEKGLEIDHIDRNQKNNHISNLRYVSKTKNILNRDAKGYYYVKRYKKWQATLRWKGKAILAKYCSSEEEAHAAYVEAKNRLMASLV